MLTNQMLTASPHVTEPSGGFPVDSIAHLKNAIPVGNGKTTQRFRLTRSGRWTAFPNQEIYFGSFALLDAQAPVAWVERPRNAADVPSTEIPDTSLPRADQEYTPPAVDYVNDLVAPVDDIPDAPRPLRDGRLTDGQVVARATANVLDSPKIYLGIGLVGLITAFLFFRK